LLLIATDAYNRYVAATGAVLDSATGLLQITSAQYAGLQSLFFNINDVNIPTSFYQDVTDILVR
jgi:cathepsin E